MHVDTASLKARERDLVRLVETHQAGLWRYLRFLGCDASQAEDLLQETFLTVWRRPFQDRGPAAAGAYLRTVARRLFLTAVRRARVRPAFSELDEAAAVWEARVREDDGTGYREALRKCLESLGARARRSLTLLYRDGLSRKEIGAALEMTADGVKTLLRRTRSALRECIERKVGA